MFRQVFLPPEIHGQLYLHSMPGRYEFLSDVFNEMQALSIDRIFCLAAKEEIAEKSPAYAKAIKSKELPCAFTEFPIEDFSVPTDRRSFAEFVSQAAAQVRNNQRVLLHCAGGIGRTGTVASCILMALGVTKDVSIKIIGDAGSRPERVEQWRLVAWYAEEVSSDNVKKSSPG